MIMLGFKRDDFVSWFRNKYGFGNYKSLKERYEFLREDFQKNPDEDSYNLMTWV